MGGGTGSEHANRHEEPAVETQTSLTGDLEVDLDPEDVWTLGQLIQAGAVSFPPGVAEELMTGYRILQASGYRPPEGAETKVELRGSGQTAGLELPIEDLEEEGNLTARRVLLTEIASTEDEHREPGATVEPGVDAEAPSSLAARDGDEAPAQSVPASAPVGPDETRRLAAAIERLADGIEETGTGSVELAAPPTATVQRPESGLPFASLTVDWALIGLGLTVATLFVVAAGMLADPVFAILGLAVLGFACFQSYPYLAESSEEGEQ